MKTSKFLAVICSLGIGSSDSVAAVTTDELIERINANQAKGIAYILTPEEVAQLENSDDPVAHYFLGLVYAEGDTPDTSRDQCKAAEHMQISAKGGYPYAQLYLGYANLWGLGLKPTPMNALSWYGAAQKTFISANLKDEKQPLQPYNFLSAQASLDRSLRCSADLLELLGLNKDSQIAAPVDNVYAKPCITDNVAGPVPNPLLERLPSGRISVTEDKPDLGWWCPPKPHQVKDVSKPD